MSSLHAGNDRPLPEDAAIDEAHPLKTGRHDLYAEAARMVGAKHSKGALVELVNWLLSRLEPQAPSREQHYVKQEIGWMRIGRYCDVDRRSLWLRWLGQDQQDAGFELCAGREGGDNHVKILPTNPAYAALADVLSTQVYAVECREEAEEAGRCAKDAGYERPERPSPPKPVHCQLCKREFPGGGGAGHCKCDGTFVIEFDGKRWKMEPCT